jgi:hypothetical protein
MIRTGIQAARSPWYVLIRPVDCCGAGVDRHLPGCGYKLGYPQTPTICQTSSTTTAKSRSSFQQVVNSLKSRPYRVGTELSPFPQALPLLRLSINNMKSFETTRAKPSVIGYEAGL